MNVLVTGHLPEEIVALLEALQERRIAGAGLDVYEHEPALTPVLADLDKPHPSGVN
jgi:lactate dehydrogenase-like 2-hydroxyacid dehydrogenase